MAGGILQAIKENTWIVTLIVGAFGAYGGFVTGQTTTEERLANVEKRMDTAESRLSRGVRFNACTIRSLDQLQTAHPEITPRCSLEIE